ncbi:micrococcal nuclease-like nuclease [Aequorivita sublithincola DSM 14238]|uniref:Micrococcal nuclease-like nuclease n=1 Tax=Aequorivita sublithincola (strain DSM 14238 / LMG 21431 / ACAM 643 / 9-3) TaxID=746697 RepID=I3YRV0_AEQSU|nr:thermonuclease family protein [Aequorivita sublithincola]AFL79718.1 micrococcal nuclease-like nuclease [Aequorivita sublithincola DSM 14238]
MKNITLLILLLSFIPCLSQTLTGKVVGIMDGDTFKLLTQDSTVIKVRLANIDCPEKKQPFSNRAKEFTSQSIFGKMVCIDVLKKDRYRRSIANVFYNDSLNLSSQLVKNGLAWHYIKYSKDVELQKIEDKARKNKIGLWQDPKAIPPWEWRDNKKKKIKK